MAACSINEIKTNTQLEEFLFSKKYIVKEDLGNIVTNKDKLIDEVKDLGLIRFLRFEKEFEDQENSREFINIKPFDYTFHKTLKEDEIDFSSVRDSTEFILNENLNLKSKLEELVAKPEFLSKDVNLKDLYKALEVVNANIKELKEEAGSLAVGVLKVENSEEALERIYNKLLSQFDYYLNQEGSFSWVQANNYDKALDTINDAIKDISSLEDIKGELEFQFIQEKKKDLGNLKRSLKKKKRNFLKKISEGFNNPDKILELINEESRGLNDADIFSQYFLSPDIGLGSNQSIMSQILRGEITKSSNKQMSIANYLAKNMDRNFKDLEKYLEDNDLTFLYSDQILKGGKRVIDQRKLMEYNSGVGRGNSVIQRYTKQWFDWLSNRDKIVTLNKESIDDLSKRDKSYTYTTSLQKNITDREAVYSKNNREAIVITPSMIISQKNNLIELLGKNEYEKLKEKVSKKEKVYSQMREVKEEEFKRNYPLGSSEYQKDLDEWDKRNNPNEVDNYLYTNRNLPHSFQFNEVIPNPHHKKSKLYINQEYIEFSKHEPLVKLLDSIHEAISFENIYNPDRSTNDSTITLDRNDYLSKIADLFANKGFLGALYKLLTGAIKNPSKIVTLYKDILQRFVEDVSTNTNRLTTINSSFKANGLYNDRVNKSFMQNNSDEIEADSILILSELRKLDFDSTSKTGNYWTFARNNDGFSKKGQINISDNDALVLKEYVGSHLSDDSYIEELRNGTKVLKLEDIARNIATKRLLENSSPDIISAIKMKNLSVARYSASRAIEDSAVLIKDQFKGLKTDSAGNRNKDNQRFDEYYDRVFLLKDTKTQTLGFNRNNETKENFKIPSFLSNALDVSGHRELTKNIVDAINASRDTDLFPKEKIKLQRFLKNNKKDITLSDIIFAFGKAFRFIGIGYSLRSGLNNIIEGSMTLASASVYYDSLGIIDIKDTQEKDSAYWLGKQFSKLKNNDYIKMKKLLSMHDFLQDAANMIQLANTSKEENDLESLDVTSAFSAIRYTEKHVQYPLIYALMKKTSIKGSDGSEVNMWDAIEFDKNGDLKLKDNFDTKENEIWVKPTIGSINESSGEYWNLSMRVERMLSDTQGDFSDKGGMLIKSNPLGMLLMLFRTWWPAVMRSWFKGNHYDLLTNTNQKGKITATTGATGAAIMSILALPFGGPLWAGVMAGVGYIAGTTMKSNYGNIDISVKDDIFNLGKASSKRAVNILAAPINAFLKPLFDKKIGFSNITEGLNFGDTDIKDRGLLMSQYYSIGQAMAWGTVMMFIKALFFDDEDEPDSAKRQAFNFFGNQAMNFYGQSVESVNLISVVSDMSQFPSENYVTKMSKVITSTMSTIGGNSINPNTGDYVMGEAMQKFIPGDLTLLTQHIFGGGYVPADNFYSNRVYGVNKWLQSDEKAMKAKIKSIRKRYKNQQEKLFPDLEDKDILKIVNRDRPSFGQLQKKGINPYDYDLYN